MISHRLRDGAEELQRVPPLWAALCHSLPAAQEMSPHYLLCPYRVLALLWFSLVLLAQKRYRATPKALKVHGDNVPSRAAGPLLPCSHTAHGLGTVTRPHCSPAAISTLLGHSTACRGHVGHVGDDRGEARAAAVGEGRWRPPSVFFIPCSILNAGFNPVQEGLGV